MNDEITFRTPTDSTGWIELALAACNHAGLIINHDSIGAIATWDQQYCANAIYRLNNGQHNEQYLKIYGPNAQRQFYIERSVLRTLADHPEIPAPRILMEGEQAGYPPYLVITAIPGATAEDLWDNLSRDEQLTLAREFGTITAAIHRLPQDELAKVEQRVGGREAQIAILQARNLEAIEAIETFSPSQRDALAQFVRGEARDLLERSLKLTHFDLAHNHIYLTRESGVLKVTGLIDWGEAMLGPAAWDVVYLWFWTFSRDREAMRECLRMMYPEGLPERFARRCMAAVIYTFSMSLLWPDLVRHGLSGASVESEMTEFFFPLDVFGSPD